MRRVGAGGEGDLPVVCMNGGVAGARPGDWSSTLEWLLGEVAPRLPGLALYQLRYRVKSWNRLDMCMADARAAIDGAGAEPGGDGAQPRPTALLGYSMGGAVAIAVAGHPAVSTVVGLAPWIPDRLDLSGLDGRRFAAIQGSWDAYLPGIPGVSAASSRRGFERIRRRGVQGDYTLIGGGLHPIALRAPWGLTPLPRAARWAELVTAELTRFRDAAPRES